MNVIKPRDEKIFTLLYSVLMYVYQSLDTPTFFSADLPILAASTAKFPKTNLFGQKKRQMQF